MRADLRLGGVAREVERGARDVEDGEAHPASSVVFYEWSTAEGDIVLDVTGLTLTWTRERVLASAWTTGVADVVLTSSDGIDTVLPLGIVKCDRGVTR